MRVDESDVFMSSLGKAGVMQPPCLFFNYNYNFIYFYQNASWLAFLACPKPSLFSPFFFRDRLMTTPSKTTLSREVGRGRMYAPLHSRTASSYPPILVVGWAVMSDDVGQQDPVFDPEGDRRRRCGGPRHEPRQGHPGLPRGYARPLPARPRGCHAWPDVLDDRTTIEAHGRRAVCPPRRWARFIIFYGRGEKAEATLGPALNCGLFPRLGS